MVESLDRILLVDDDTVTNLMHKRQITRRGLARHVDVATDGQSALEYLQRRAENGEDAPGLVLLDINMPRMNGFEFLRAYAEMPQACQKVPRIVMVSTSTLRQDRQLAEVDPLVEAYETKPLTDNDLVRIVHRHVPPPSPSTT